jgi:hypothetical protein
MRSMQVQGRPSPIPSAQYRAIKFCDWRPAMGCPPPTPGVSSRAASRGRRSATASFGGSGFGCALPCILAPASYDACHAIYRFDASQPARSTRPSRNYRRAAARCRLMGLIAKTGRPVRFELTEQTPRPVDAYPRGHGPRLKTAGSQRFVRRDMLACELFWL